MATLRKKHHTLLLLCAILTIVGCTGKQMDADRAEMTETVRNAQHNLKMGWEYDGQRHQMRLAELYYRKSYEILRDDPSQDWFTYADAGYRYACLLRQRGDMEGALTIATEVLKKAEGNENFPVAHEAFLRALMAECQLALAMPEAAKQNYAKAYERQLTVLDGEQKGDLNLAVMCSNFFLSSLEMGEYNEAGKWLSRYEEEFRVYERSDDCDSLIISEHHGLLALYKAQLLQATGRAKDAAAIYAAIPQSQLVNPACIESAVKYLMDAGRYDEAADMYARLDMTFAAVDSARTTFDVISHGLAPRYIANRRAGRIAEALEVADKTYAAIDSALVWEKQSDAAELAVIYQTHEKDLAIEKSEARATIYRIILASTAVILLLIAYLLYRAHKYNKELMEKNRSLYEQMQQRERAEDVQREQMQSQPTESLSQNKQLYRRLCERMKDPAVYTDAETNHETLARLLGTNRTYINDALHECADITPADFINQYRIRHAARLLASTNDPIGIIIEQSGITNRATFSRLFREHYSMTPSEYRLAARAETKLA